MSQQQNIERIEAGREATFVRGAIQGIVDDQIRTSVVHLVSMYRQGGIDHDMLVGKVAEIAALESLMAELDSRERRAEVAIEREFGNGKKDE